MIEAALLGGLAGIVAGYILARLRGPSPRHRRLSMTRVRYALTALALAAAACSPPVSETTPPQPGAPAVPAEIAAVASAAAPGITITNAEPDAGNSEYEVTGKMPNGEEIELDLEESNGAWIVMEIQRDVAWPSVPEAVRAAATAAPNSFEPVRVIESKQPRDGSVIFELFSAQDQDGSPGGGPAMEVRWHDGKAAVISPAP